MAPASGAPTAPGAAPLAYNAKGAAMYVKWRGSAEYPIADGRWYWLIGQTPDAPTPDHVIVRRLDGELVDVQTARLCPASRRDAEWAAWLGGYTIPLAGRAPEARSRSAAASG